MVFLWCGSTAMSLICSCGRPFEFVMCQHFELASFALQCFFTLVAIRVVTCFGVFAVPVPSDGRQIEHIATYDTLPWVNTAEESHEPCGGFGGVKTVFHVEEMTSSSLGS